MPKRVDAEDMGDIALHVLHRAQAEGLVVADVGFHAEHEVVKPSGRRLLIGATLTIRLVPARDKQ